MSTHGYQAKELLRGYGVAVLQGFVAWTQAEAAAAKLPGPVFVVESQIHAGGRGAGVSLFRARKLAYGLGLGGKQVGGFPKFVLAVHRAFAGLDCAVVEISPLVVTEAGDVVALDAKVGFDDNAGYRQPALEALRDKSEEDPKELEAGEYGLNSISPDGTIGCMVNGAGLAMATMDISKPYGGSPATFPPPAPMRSGRSMQR